MKHICSILFIILSLSIHAQDTSVPTLIAKGSAVAKIKPDLMTITFEIRKSEKDETVVIEKLRDATEKLVIALEEIQIPRKEIKVSEYGIEKDNKFYGQSPNPSYTANSTLEITVPLSMKLLGLSVERIVKTNSSDIDFGVEFKLSKELEDKNMDSLMNQAIENASRKAVAMSKAAGLELLKIRHLAKGFNSFENEPLRALDPGVKSAAAGDVGDSQIISSGVEVKEIELREEVSIVYDINSGTAKSINKRGKR